MALPPGSRPSRSSLGAAGLALACLLMAGCTRVQLAKLPIDSIAADLPQAKAASGPGIAPGEKLPLVVTFTQPDGKLLVTEGKGKGKVRWRDLQVTASVVTADQKGNVSLPQDPRFSDGKLPHVSITVPSHPELRAELDIPLRYDRKFSARFSGYSGSSGSDGTAGSDGSNGSDGSIDPEHPSPGGDGGNGSDGGNGGDGGPGGDGPAVAVRVALRPGAHPLLQIAVAAEGRESFYLVDPQGGSLTVSSSGGSGGSGGRGGRGGRGGSGGNGSPRGSSGRSGSDGRSGSNGSPGRDGDITVIYDPQAKPFLGALRLAGGSTAFREQALPPLW